MNEERKILLVEDDPEHAHVITRYLRKADRRGNKISLVKTLAEAKDALTNDSFDAILLDLSLPDSPIHNTLQQMVQLNPVAPLIVLTSINDLEFATAAVQQGAQDYLVKSELNTEALDRSIRYAIERKHAQMQLEDYATQLKESNRHLENFAHTLAHEIRSPLTVISGCLQMIEHSHAKKLEAELGELLGDSLMAVRGISELVETLLEFSQANAQQLAFKPVDLEAIFFHVYALLRPLINEASAVVTHDPLPEIYGNEIQLRQLLLNLINNALKYRGDEDPRVHVGCTDHSDNWTIYVSDNGRGISANDQQRIFDAFTRLDVTPGISGVGIGLAFCKRIVELHEGKIWVESEPGKGSTFFVSVPKRAPNEIAS